MIGVIVKLIKVLPVEERRGWVVKMMLNAKGMNFADIARKHRLTRWYVAGCVNGAHPWSPRIVLALEHSVGVEVRELLTEQEAAKLREYEKGEGK